MLHTDNVQNCEIAIIGNALFEIFKQLILISKNMKTTYTILNLIVLPLLVNITL